MSWIIALSNPSKERPSGVHFHPRPLHTISMPGFYIAVGGIPETCTFEHDEIRNTGFAVVGTGIFCNRVQGSSETSRQIMTVNDWRSVLSHDAFEPTELDGHFVVVRWNRNRVETFTDQLGLRALYFGRRSDELCISTHLHWVAHAVGRTEIDYACLGSRWLLVNQIGYESGVMGIQRLGPCGHAVFEAGSTVSCKQTSWVPEFQDGTIKSALEVLSSLVQCAFEGGRTPSLSLSGGLDSRLLLAMLVKERSKAFLTHTFGVHTDPDVEIAGLITKDLGIEHLEFDDRLPEVKQLIPLMCSYVAETMLVEPVSSVTKLRYYPKIRERADLVIDGGCGELARRQYLNRVVKLGRAALRSKNLSQLLLLMRSRRSTIFARDILTRMEQGALESLEKALDEMPPVERIGIENFADLLTARTRIPNYAGPEQARMDGEILNFMPLAQPSFLRSVFSAPVSSRAHGRWYLDVIRRAEPRLSQYRLVKSGMTYTFGLSSNAAWLMTKVKSSLGMKFSDEGPDRLLTHLREFVLDLVHSKDVTTNPAYDTQRIIQNANRYYRGQTDLRNSVDWWLTFEMWRRSLSRRAHD